MNARFFFAVVVSIAALPRLGGAAEDPLGPLASELVVGREVKAALPLDAGAPLWDGVPATPVVVVPQRSVHLHDRTVNEGLPALLPRTVEVRSAFDDRSLAIVVDWPDDTEDRARPDETAAFGDGVALEIPLDFGAGKRLPYVGMGDEAMRVALYLQRATLDGANAAATVRESVAAGFGSSTRADLGGMRPSLRYDAGHKRWRAVFLRPLATPGHDLRRGLVPFAVAVWDGGRRERGGNKALSPWKLLRLPRHPVDATFAGELAWGHRPGDLGDPARGKVLVESVCVACHHVGERRIAPVGLGPDLSNIGAIAAPSYLRDSVVDPSRVIVPHPNANQHYRRAGPVDANGAFPNNDQFAWHTRDASGKAVSKMPPFAGFPRADLDGIVAFLRTLGAPPRATAESTRGTP